MILTMLAVAAVVLPAQAEGVVFQRVEPEWDCTGEVAASCLASAAATEDGHVTVDLSATPLVAGTAGAAEASAYVRLGTWVTLDHSVPELTLTAVVDVRSAKANVVGAYADAFGENGSSAYAYLDFGAEHDECCNAFTGAVDIVVYDTGDRALSPLGRAPGYPKERNGETMLLTVTMRRNSGLLIPPGAISVYFRVRGLASLGGLFADTGEATLSLDINVRDIILS